MNHSDSIPMTSFVTGATGFIGQRLLVRLEANGVGGKNSFSFLSF